MRGSVDIKSRGTRIIEETFRAKQAGHFGLFTLADLALLIDEEPSDAFTKFISRFTKTGSLERVARGIYINPLCPPNTPGVLEKIASLLHWQYFFYASLESELSNHGLISQITIQYLSLMTKGRSGRHATKYGTVEFTHTKRSVESLKNSVYFDLKTGIFRATKQQAIIDLKRVGRNVDMLVEEE